MMLEKINNLLQEVEGLALSTKEQVEEYRIKWLSKKGQITVLFDEFKTVTPEVKRELGQKLNDLKNKAQEKIITPEELDVFNLVDCNFINPVNRN